MKLKYNKWDEVPISVYKNIVEALNNEDKSTTEKSLSALAILCDTDEDTIYSMNITDVNDLLEDMDWIYEFDFEKEVKFKKINVGKYKCNLEVDVNKMNVAQYVDFQSYWSKAEFNENMSKVISCFLIPEGKNYSDGYDVVDLINEIENNLSITVANSIMFFFLQKSMNSIDNTITSSISMMKKKAKKTKDKVLKEKLLKTIAAMQQSNFFLGFH